MPRRVLFIEDTASSLAEECSAALDCVSECAAWDSPLREGLREREPDLVVAVAAAANPVVTEFFRWLANNSLGAPTLAILPASEDLMRAAVEAVDDFIVAPFHPGELQHRMGRLLGGKADESEKAAAHEHLTRELALTGLVGRHPAFLRTLNRIPVVARNHSPVLITGETGTGKELFARAIHHLGVRRHQPFLPVDCAALPEHLFESEMFGHARGAFTDAHRDQKGLVALAGAGTLFLDEIDSLPIAAQSKLLRLLQERTYRPVGSERFVRTDVKIVAACNQDLERLVQEKHFRSDLFFRLNVLRLHLAPLRDRRSDIPCSPATSSRRSRSSIKRRARASRPHRCSGSPNMTGRETSASSTTSCKEPSSSVPVTRSSSRICATCRPGRRPSSRRAGTFARNARARRGL